MVWTWNGHYIVVDEERTPDMVPCSQCKRVDYCWDWVYCEITEEQFRSGGCLKKKGEPIPDGPLCCVFNRSLIFAIDGARYKCAICGCEECKI